MSFEYNFTYVQVIPWSRLLTFKNAVLLLDVPGYRGANQGEATAFLNLVGR